MIVTGWIPVTRHAAGASSPPEHTPAELADMIRVASYENDQTQAALAQCHDWLASDPRGYGEFSDRVTTHGLKLPPIVERAERAIHQAPGLSPLDRNGPSSASYAELIAWRTEGTALYREWAGLAEHNPKVCPPPNYAKTPQPTAPDPGAQFLKDTTPIAHGVDDVAAAAREAADTAKQIATSRTPYVLLGAGVALGALFLLRR